MYAGVVDAIIALNLLTTGSPPATKEKRAACTAGLATEIQDRTDTDRSVAVHV